MERAHLAATGFLFDLFTLSGVVDGAGKIKRIQHIINVSSSGGGRHNLQGAEGLFTPGKNAWDRKNLSDEVVVSPEMQASMTNRPVAQ